MAEDEKNKWLIFACVALGVFMSTLDSSIVNIALPYIMQDMGTGVETIQWVVVGYLLTISSLLLTFGRLSDIRGKRMVYTGGFLIFTAGSGLCAMAQTPLFLIISRVVQACGAAMLMACSPALIVDTFPVRERGKALGMVGAVVAAGLTAGPVAGGILLDLFSWRFIFYINIPIGIGAALAGSLILKNGQSDPGSLEPMDKTGSLLQAVSLVCLIVVLTHLNQWQFFSAKTMGFLLTFAMASLGFVWNETQTLYPLFDPALLKIRLFVLPVITSAILFGTLFVIVFMMPFFLVHPCGLSASATGLIMITPFILLFFISPVSGALYNRTGSRGPCSLGMTILALALFAFARIEPSSGMTAIVSYLALAGTGTALFVSPNNTAAMGAVPANRRGIASATVATARNLGMVIGVATAGLIFTGTFTSLNHGTPFQTYSSSVEPMFMAGFHRAMAAGAIMACLGSILSFLRGDDRPRVH
ncbi:multidrug resistance protein (efflux pump/antiporter) [Desulforapulum autotrophicum HRM2]|uniref:Multidrug resistance protein (Efflux pump/antiporter) n=1 Tax=Desulforapulum autotrophicum (strain ATCC 43914 / DSM 3382 / VKM B-1955 / HRM2) TaxID=177437 RepID=C0QKD8_DESAH|nr:MFS transporter [Desulforapulum autotrophicum]ACN14009.1 multidrug resistance protein (efflux pump/antiporter) [Desulforapulum autotrophicum HRM2]